MAISITSTVLTESQQWRCSVVLQSYVTVADPVGYVSGSTTVQAEILAAAGLDADLTFVSAALSSTGTLGSLKLYNLIVIFGATLAQGSHTHDCTTVTHSLQCGYDDGPTVDLDATLGPVILQRPSTADIIMLRVKIGSTDLFRVGASTITRFGTHAEFYPDATYDIGTPDAGATLYRPRDVRVGRNIFAVGNGTYGGYGIFGDYVRGRYHVCAQQAVNPSSDPTVRHIYVNSVDNTLRYWDGTVEHILGTTSGSDTLGLWNCGVGVQVGHAVYCNGADSVDSAEASVLAGRQPLGICVSKPTGITAVVRYIGELAIFVGLSPGAQYFVAKGVAGALTTSLVGFAADDTVAPIGVAKNNTTLAILPTTPDVW